MGERRALLIAVGTHEDPTLNRLASPSVDVSAFAGVLGDPAIGDFRTELIVDGTAADLRRRVEGLFLDGRRSDDELLLYFTGHGLKDANGRLYFAAADTSRTRLRSTSLPATFVHELSEESPSRRQLIILDCCYSGAYVRGMKGDESVAAGEMLQGAGRAVLTASDSLQFSFEGEVVHGRPSQSRFTAAMVEGLRTGRADRDGDGWITADELYEYAYEQLRRQEAGQRPTRTVVGGEGRLLVGRATRRPPPPVPLISDDTPTSDDTPRPVPGPPVGLRAVVVALVVVALATVGALAAFRSDGNKQPDPDPPPGGAPPRPTAPPSEVDEETEPDVVSTASAWPVVFRETFDDNSREWFEDTIGSDEDGSQQYRLRDGQYEITVQDNANKGSFYSTKTKPIGSEMLATVAVTPVSTPGESTCGLSFELAGGDRLFAGVAPDEAIATVALFRDREISRLMVSDVVPTGRQGPPTVGLLVAGTQGTFIVDGRIVDSFSSDKVGDVVGVGVGAQFGDTMTCRYDDLTVRAPDRP